MVLESPVSSWYQFVQMSLAALPATTHEHEHEHERWQTQLIRAHDNVGLTRSYQEEFDVMTAISSDADRIQRSYDVLINPATYTMPDSRLCLLPGSNTLQWAAER